MTKKHKKTNKKHKKTNKKPNIERKMTFKVPTSILQNCNSIDDILKVKATITNENGEVTNLKDAKISDFCHF